MWLPSFSGVEPFSSLLTHGFLDSPLSAVNEDIFGLRELPEEFLNGTDLSPRKDEVSAERFSKNRKKKLYPTETPGAVKAQKEREDVIRGIYLHVDQSSKEFMCRSRKQACSSSAKCPNTLRISGSLCFLEGSGKSRKQIIKLEHRHSRQRKTHPIGCKGRLNSHVSSMRLMRVN